MSHSRPDLHWSQHTGDAGNHSQQQHFAYAPPPPHFDHSPTSANFPASAHHHSPMSMTHSPLSATFPPTGLQHHSLHHASHDLLPDGFQSYSPDPYSRSPALAQPPLTNSSSLQHRSSAFNVPSKNSVQQLPTPALSSSSTQSTRNQIEQYTGPIGGSQAPVSSSFPAFSSSHTYSYPNTAYPPNSASGSSSSARSESAISPLSATGSFPPGSLPSSAAMAAATNRRKMADAKAAQRNRGEGGDGADASDPSPPAPKKPSMSVRQAVELDFACHFCGRPLAKLTLRGKDVQTSARHNGTYYCRVCVPLPYSPVQPTATVNHLEEEATYADTISGAVDRLEGLDVNMRDTRPPPAVRGPHGTISANKKRKNTDSEVLTCDVCHRDLGTGGLQFLAGIGGSQLDCTIEVLCAHCESTYFRCSDCGGGGGNRG